MRSVSGESTAASISTRLQVETIMHSETPGTCGKSAGRIRQLVARDGDAFAQLDGRGFVVDADENELAHGAPNLCTWLTRLAAQTRA